MDNFSEKVIKQGKNTKKYFQTFKVISYVIKKLLKFCENWKFYKGSFGEIMKKFLINSKKISENL